MEPPRAGVAIDVRVTPRASRPGVAGWRDSVLLVRLASPPVDGAANEELLEIMASALGVPRRAVTIVAGARGRTKRVQVVGVDAATMDRRLGRNR